MEEQKKSNRGGRREGAGRPATGRKRTVSLRLSNEAMSILDEKPNKSEFVDRLIVATK